MSPDTHVAPKSARFPAVRHQQVALLLPGILLAYSCRINLSVGIVSMTDTTSNSSFPTVQWDTADKGTILGMFFYGYTIGGPPSGFLLNKLSVSKTLGSAAVICGFCNVIFPWIALEWGFTASCIMRVVQGLIQACFFPSTLTLISRWGVPKEQGWINSIICGGVPLGSAVTLIIGGLLAAGPAGWQSIFYVSGGVLTAWGVVCFIFVHDSPNEHKTISVEERVFIESQMKFTNKTKKPDVPWLKILLSVPIWACILTSMAFNWGYWTLSTLVPTYLKSTLQFDTSENGFLSSLPNLGMFACCLAFPICDKILTESFKLSTGFKRKLWTTVCLFIPAIAMLVLAYSHVSPTATVALLVIATAMNAGIYQGFQISPLDLSTHFTALIAGICNGMSSITAIVAPTIAGLLIHDETNFADWQIVFQLAAIIYVAGNIIFLIFGSGEVQEWDKFDETTTHVDIEMKK